MSRYSLKVELYDEAHDCWDNVELPAHYEVCWRCHGEGAHVNPSIDGNGISTDDECWQDDDFREMYFGGGYDVTCHKCEGRNVVLVVDEDQCEPAMLARYHQHLHDEWESRAADRSERAYFGYDR